jgi:hypothetical protein
MAKLFCFSLAILLTNMKHKLLILKIMKKIKKLLFIFLAVLAMQSCNKDENEVVTTPTTTGGNLNPGASISRDFIGQILDESNNPIAGANVKIAGITKTTDVNGIFIIKNAGVNERFAYITATKSGYVNGSRSLVPTIGENKVTIMMLTNPAKTNVNSGAVSTVTLAGAEVKFDGAFQDAITGVSYSGVVQVGLNELKSSDSNLTKKMPGMLLGQATDGSEKVLETFGMMNVQLTGSSGQKLQIATGHSAQITLNIDASQMSIAPATIPLWHFDETLGYWKQEGTATKTGNKYIGTVSHFSWWNCDYPNPRATLFVNVVNATGGPVNNVRVDIIQSAYPLWPRSGYTNTSGQVSGIVPANETHTIKVYDACGTQIYTANIGPFAVGSANTLPNIVFPATGITTVTGSLKKCDGSNVTNGYVLLNSTSVGSAFALITAGNFSFPSSYCASGASFTLIGYDYDNLQTTGNLTFTYSSPITNVGNIAACNAVTEFISCKIDSNPITNILSNFQAGNNQQNLGFSASGSIPGVPPLPSKNLFISSNTKIVGTGYTTAQFFLEGSVLSGFGVGNIINNSTPNTIVFNLNGYGPIGGYIDMTFNGTFTDTAAVVHTISGTVHVLRQF